MATMRQIRSRIRVAKNIQQITKAMKLVAAARLRRAQDAVVSARPYCQSMRNVISSVAGSSRNVSHPLLRPVQGEPRSIGVLVITGDRGLCGSYNANAIRRAWDLARNFNPEQVSFVCVGQRGARFFKHRGYKVIADFDIQSGSTTFARAREVAAVASKLFENEEVDILHLVYTRFVSAMSQHAECVQLFPVDPPEGGVSSNEIEFEPSAEEILAALLPRYIDTLVYQAMVESRASFFGSQMTSMSSATDNAGKMIGTLTLSLNRARQATITREISEIVAGADALG